MSENSKSKKKIIENAITNFIVNGSGQFKIIIFTNLLFKNNEDLSLDYEDYLKVLDNKLEVLRNHNVAKFKKRATTAQENLKKLSKFEKDTLISILYERNKEIDERKATKKIEDNLTNYLRGQMASGIRNVCDGYHDSFLSMAEKSFYEIKNPNYSGNKKNTNDDNDNDSSNSTSDKSVNNEDDKKDKDNYVIDENHDEKDDVLNEEYDTLDENEVNEFELPLKLKNYGVCSEENELDSSESLFESISNDICIDEEAVTKINPSNKNRPNEVTEAIKTLYEMVIQKFDLCDESMDETKKRLSPMHYRILDLTGRDINTKITLGNLYRLARLDYATSITYKRHVLTAEEAMMFENNVQEPTKDQKRIRRLMEVCDERLDENTNRTPSTELQHCLKNFLHFVEATEPRGQLGKEFDCQWGDKSLSATSARKSIQKDPQSRAPIGKKCDYIVLCKSIAWNPELLIGEVSGGLPRCPQWKFWHDLLIKCALGSRDCIWRILNEMPYLTRNDIESTKIYSFQLVGSSLYVYCTNYYRGVFRFAMVDYCTLPVSIYETEQRKEVYCVMKGLFESIEAEAKQLVQLAKGKKRVRPMSDYDPEAAYKALKVVPSPPDKNENEYY